MIICSKLKHCLYEWVGQALKTEEIKNKNRNNLEGSGCSMDLQDPQGP